MTEKQMNAEQKAVAALDRLGAEIVWLDAVESVYFIRERITDADLKHVKGCPGPTTLTYTTAQ